jgi:hypothetical protein
MTGNSPTDTSSISNTNGGNIVDLLDEVEHQIERLKEGFCKSLEDKKTQSIIVYLVRISIEPIAKLYKSRQEEATILIGSIWGENKNSIKSLLDSHKFDEANIVSSIEELLSDQEKSKLLEALLYYVKAISKMERIFESDESVLRLLRLDLSRLHNQGVLQSTVVNIAAEKEIVAPISRGDLKIDVELSKPYLVAGTEFSIFVKITNPYDVPIVINSVETHIPVELVVSGRERSEANLCEGIAKGFATFDCEYLNKHMPPMPYLLQPDDRICKQIILNTRGNWVDWLRFTPVSLVLEIQVRYGVDHRQHMDTVKAEINIQASLEATIIGALIGGFIGGVARLLNSAETFDPGKSIAYIILSIIISVMAVVAFARKTGVQKIVSIEDAWGGLMIGFVVGYQGPEWAMNVIMGDSSASVANNLTATASSMASATQNITTSSDILANQTQNLSKSVEILKDVTHNILIAANASG